jgi:hypothetical protein
MVIYLGTGAWAIDFAKRYPSASIVGVDLKKLQPSSHPSNVRFVIDSVMEEGAWNSSPHQLQGSTHGYDFIRSRSISSGIADWDGLLNLVWKHLRPGGWVELQEFHLPMRCDDGSMAGTAFERWNQLIVESTTKAGIKLDGGFASVPGLLEAMKFARLGRVQRQWAIGPWPKDEIAKEIGRMFRAVSNAFDISHLDRVAEWT